MMKLPERLSTISLRDGFTVVGEIVAFSALGASLAWMMWSAVEPVTPLSTGAAPQQTDTFEQLAKRFSRIPEVHLGATARSVQLDRDAGGFALFGARVGVNGGGTAIISVNGAPQAAFAVGDEIAPGARLARVGSDHVEIDSASGTFLVAFAGALEAPSPLLAGPAAHKPSTDLANSLINSLSLRPVSRGSEASGFEVTSEASLSALGVSGLRAGDILLKINGINVSPETLAAQASQLQAGHTVDVVYERNGQISTARIGTAAP